MKKVLYSWDQTYLYLVSMKRKVTDDYSTKGFCVKYDKEENEDSLYEHCCKKACPWDFLRHNLFFTATEEA